MLTGVSTLDDFPFSEQGYGREVAVVAIGSPGCRIAAALSGQKGLLEHYIYVTCDEHDLLGVTRGEKLLIDAKSSGKGTPFRVRGLAYSVLPELKKQLSDSKVVFIVAGLGGSVGSGLAPLVAQVAKEINKETTIVSILVMPQHFEKPKHFYAGVALGQMRSLSTGVILIDNDQLFDAGIPFIDAYAIINEKIATSLNKLLGAAEKHEFSLGLANVVDFVKTSSYSVLCLGESKDCREAVMDAVSKFDKTVDVKEAMKSIVHLCADKSITMKEVAMSIGGLSGLLGNGTMQVDYGLSANSATMTTAVIIATGFTTTKFDSYDPVGAALKSKNWNMDSSLDSTCDVPMLLSNLEVTV